MRVQILSSRPRASAEIQRDLLTNHCFVAEIASFAPLSEGHGPSAFDAVVMDAIWPSIVQSVMSLRSGAAHTPILAIGPAVDKDAVALLLDSGADDYLVRPLDPHELTSRVLALVRRSRGHSTSYLRFRDLTLDMTTGSVSKMGVALPLTVLEYRLLEHLVLHRGDTIAPEELSAAAFGMDPQEIGSSLQETFSGVCRKAGLHPIDLTIDICGRTYYRLA